MTAEDKQLQAEKEQLMREFKQLHGQLHDLKRVHENFAREIADKDSAIARLKETKADLDHALEQLMHENQNLREHRDKLSHENNSLRSELNTAKNAISKIEVQLQNSIKQRNIMKEQFEIITQNNSKGSFLICCSNIFTSFRTFVRRRKNDVMCVLSCYNVVTTLLTSKQLSTSKRRRVFTENE